MEKGGDGANNQKVKEEGGGKEVSTRGRFKI
jgi:hypothetical protein